MQTVNFLGYECSVEVGKYKRSKSHRLQLFCAEVGPIATATVNVPGTPLEVDECIIKDYSENTGILDALIQSQIVTPTSRKVQVGWEVAVVCKLNKP